jgi:hypothetical protein
MKYRYILLLGLFLLIILVEDSNRLYAQREKQDKDIYLIIRGDDIGSCHAANLACIRSYKEGIMRTVELMVPCPWFPEAVKLLNENPALDRPGADFFLIHQSSNQLFSSCRARRKASHRES